MPTLQNGSTITVKQRQELIQHIPCFASLTKKQSQELVALMQEYHYLSHETIVIENELIDSVFIIITGEAEVTREVKKKLHKPRQVPVAVLRAGEAIGLNDTGFYSSTGKRTASVTALTEMVLLRLELKDLYVFLQKNQLELTMYAASLQMLRMKFIKQSLPFAKISHDRLRWLSDHVEELHLPAGTIIFNQGEAGDKCYFVRSGQVEITTIDEELHTEKQLAILKPPIFFGEATLITKAPRNATAKAVTEADVLVLQHQYLSELLESEKNVATMFMTLMVDRSRPLKNASVTLHHRQTADQQELTILKNPENGTYFKLSNEGAYVWTLLDGKHTLQELTLALAEEYNVFAPDVVTALISRLTAAGFIGNVDLLQEDKYHQPSKIKKIYLAMKQLLEFRYALGDADPWLTNIYQKYIRYLFSKPAQFIIAAISILGLIAFISTSPDILLFFSFKHASLLLLLTLIPLGLIEVALHELGHAFAVKAVGREVHYIGIGWYWFAPIAFTDTSDMWLADRKSRMLVNLAGVYVDIFLAGFAAFLIWYIPNPYIQSILWLFAAYTYVGAFRMLSPLQELDGYYVLRDWVEKPKLRQSAMVWLMDKFPLALKNPKLFRENKPEIFYWCACIVFLILVSFLTLIMQSFVLSAIGIESPNPYLGLILPFIVVIISSLTMVVDIRNRKD